MKNRDEHLLELFFSRSLTKEERTELESRLQADPDLAADFQWQQKMPHAFALLERERMKNILQREEKKLKRNPFTARFGRIASIAATVALLLVATWFLMPQQIPEPGSLFEHYSSDSMFRDQVQVPEGASKALKAYDRKDYKEAAERFRELSLTGNSKIQYRFMEALALVGQADYARAEPMLAQLSLEQEDSEPLANASLWYLAIARIGLEKYPEARQAIEEYLKRDVKGQYAKKARKTLKSLPE